MNVSKLSNCSFKGAYLSRNIKGKQLELATQVQDSLMHTGVVETYAKQGKDIIIGSDNKDRITLSVEKLSEVEKATALMYSSFTRYVQPVLDERAEARKEIKAVWSDIEPFLPQLKEGFAQMPNGELCVKELESIEQEMAAAKNNPKPYESKGGILGFFRRIIKPKDTSEKK